MCWSVLSKNQSITPEFIEKHIDKTSEWNWNGLSNNPSITPAFIDKPYEWDGLSSNPSITSSMIVSSLITNLSSYNL